jgi:heptaprenyl diphosphate synthase
MCSGEILQACRKYDLDAGLEEYYECITKKTAIFIECCCKSGAAAAGADDLQIGLVGEFGLNLGLAFQIIDDIMDFCGDTGMMGKPNYEDIVQGHITLPVILLKSDREEYGQYICDLLRGRNINRHDAEEIGTALKRTGVLDMAFDMAVSHINKACSCLDLIPYSRYTDLLRSMAEMLKLRMN